MASKDNYHRVNRGYKLREDLIKACKRLALERDVTLYQIMEEALEEYIRRNSGVVKLDSGDLEPKTFILREGFTGPDDDDGDEY